MPIGPVPTQQHKLWMFTIARTLPTTASQKERPLNIWMAAATITAFKMRKTTWTIRLVKFRWGLYA